MSLRARLFATYLLLLTITVGAVGGALFIILSTRPAPPQPTYQRLAALAQSIPLRDLLLEASGGVFSTPEERLARVEEQLVQIAEQGNVRILIADSRTSRVAFDSAGVYDTNETIALRIEPYTVPPGIRRGFARGAQTIFGSFVDTGSDWLFAGLVLTLGRGDPAGVLLFADPRENLSLQQSLADFSSALVLPLCQSAVVGLVVASILAILGSRNIAAPLQALAEASSEVAQGHYDHRVPVSGPPEVRVLAESFNYMTGQVQATQQAQQDFLANVSHDLKTPLTSIQGYSQAIMDGATADAVGAAAIIHEEAGRLNRMVMQLTDLARLQSGRLTMHQTPLDIGQITAGVGQRLAIVARAKGITLHVDAQPMPEIIGDGDRLAQVLDNLIANAIAYTPAGGRVNVATRSSSGGVEVVVQDTGIGIPPDELPRIFERFYQVDKARGPERGTGLGLAIVREIVQAHGGRINVASAGANQGATFTIWLPLPAASAVTRKRG